MNCSAPASHRRDSITPGSAEAEIAAKFVEAAQVYENHLGALQLRAMNIIYETTKERGATSLRCDTIR